MYNYSYKCKSTCFEQVGEYQKGIYVAKKIKYPKVYKILKG